MSELKFLYRLMFSESGEVEQTCSEALEKDPKNRLALVTLTRICYERQEFDAAESLAKRAAALGESLQEMYLIAASSAFHNGNTAEARRCAALALESPDGDPAGREVRGSLAFRVLRQVPAFRRKLDALVSALEQEARHQDALLDWARQMTVSPEPEPGN